MATRNTSRSRNSENRRSRIIMKKKSNKFCITIKTTKDNGNVVDIDQKSLGTIAIKKIIKFFEKIKNSNSSSLKEELKKAIYDMEKHCFASPLSAKFVRDAISIFLNFQEAEKFKSLEDKRETTILVTENYLYHYCYMSLEKHCYMSLKERQYKNSFILVPRFDEKHFLREWKESGEPKKLFSEQPRDSILEGFYDRISNVDFSLMEEKTNKACSSFVFKNQRGKILTSLVLEKEGKE